MGGGQCGDQLEVLPCSLIPSLRFIICIHEPNHGTLSSLSSEKASPRLATQHRTLHRCLHSRSRLRRLLIALGKRRAHPSARQSDGGARAPDSGAGAPQPHSDHL